MVPTVTLMAYLSGFMNSSYNLDRSGESQLLNSLGSSTAPNAAEQAHQFGPKMTKKYRGTAKPLMKIDKKLQ